VNRRQNLTQDRHAGRPTSIGLEPLPGTDLRHHRTGHGWTLISLLGGSNLRSDSHLYWGFRLGGCLQPAKVGSALCANRVGHPSRFTCSQVTPAGDPTNRSSSGARPRCNGFSYSFNARSSGSRDSRSEATSRFSDCLRLLGACS
jgi:hypothetical protein